ncbi:MAG: 2,3-bisphosphoglycerate-independent phosphoglycerate mutase [Dehalococcoidales bacterium]|nr:2,3-bisphosphoglycerate-independent phosphoglycerate mutase [Dehalococcoidales bacterium]
MNKMTVKDVDVEGKRVLVRVDFNVPLDEKTGAITDDSRIRAALPTIEYLIERGARVILISHLGRPDGKVVDKLRLHVVAQRLSQILGQQVGITTDCIGPEVENSVARLQSGHVLLLENLRFHSDEETGSASFAQALARLADIYVNDAFGTSHRAHASIVEITHYLPAVAGFLLEKEVEALGHLLQNPARPFAALLGGAKISDKVGMLENIMGRVDYLLVGGGMAATFLKAKSFEVGRSLVEKEMLDTAIKLMEKASQNGVTLQLPVDVVITGDLNAKGKREVVSIGNIPPNKKIVDIGPQTIKDFHKALLKCHTVFWNGPMGVYEIPRFARGTQALVRYLANLNAITVVGGGSTAEVVTEMGLIDKMTFVSTGGGASLTFLAGESLPGVEALLDKRVPLESNLELIKSLAITSPDKIVLLVIDGLGGLPHPETGKTELETARIPYLNDLAHKSMCGLIDPVGPGITPGSAPGHLALFGYNPLKYDIGRGVLEAIGIDFDLQPGDLAARGNFCTVDENGLITDRRAGRIDTEQCAELCRLLDGLQVDKVTTMVRPVKEYRFVVVFRGERLAADVSDSDPQQLGMTPKTILALRPEAGRMANIANEFVAQATKILAGRYPANMFLLRGFSMLPSLPTMSEVYKLSPAAVTTYPMYRGLAKLVGMNILETGNNIEEEFTILKQNFTKYDFFYVHVKWADSAGEDGDFNRKVSILEQVDRALPILTGLNPNVIVVTGDHSTPATFKGHSWHPVPVLLHSRWCRPDGVTQFTERACATGGLGRFPATQIMPLALANAMKLTKFGA